MKVVYGFLSIIAVVICIYTFPNSASAINKQKSNTITYLDLSIDPVVPGGVTPAMETLLLQQGYVVKFLPQDLYVEGVQSKSSNGTIYYRNGWLQAGTKYYWNEAEKDNGDDGKLAACANVYSHWRWQVRAGW